ncbi:MAG: hypothetical protein IPK93_02685 [Solirubrobacterales bacterium]|nr:hypothetical protein [Solirubrobacterales bacterium]
MSGGSIFQLNHFEANRQGDIEERTLQLDGFWPTQIPLPGDPYRDEYATGVDGLRIVRVAGITAREGECIEPSKTWLLPAHPVSLVPEPTNTFDDQAIRVVGDEHTELGDEAGYIPRAMNVGVGKWFNESPGSRAWVLCQWLDLRTQIIWDGFNMGGYGSPALAMHLLLAQPQAIPLIDPNFEPVGY